MIDAISQYGLYPHLLQPLFAVVGLSPLKFTLEKGNLVIQLPLDAADMLLIDQ